MIITKLHKLRRPRLAMVTTLLKMHQNPPFYISKTTERDVLVIAVNQFAGHG